MSTFRCTSDGRVKSIKDIANLEETRPCLKTADAQIAKPNRQCVCLKVCILFGMLLVLYICVHVACQLIVGLLYIEMKTVVKYETYLKRICKSHFIIKIFCSFFVPLGFFLSSLLCSACNTDF